MAQDRSGNDTLAPGEEATEAPTEDRTPRDAGDSGKTSRASASGADQTEVRTGTGSGLSSDKGVADVGDPAMPTGNARGVEVGRPDKHGVMEGREDRTLSGQLRETGLATDESETDEE